MKLFNSLVELGTLSAIGKSNLKLDELAKQNDKLKIISSSIGASQNELVNLNKQLVQIQTRILDTQNVQIGLQQKQLLLNEQQLIIQKKQLAEQEIQTSIQTRNEIDRLKQQELKKAIFLINEELLRINKIDNKVTKYFEIVLLLKDITNNNIVPNELDNIRDKEYASKILVSIEEAYNNIVPTFNENEKQDKQFIEKYLESIDKYLSVLSSTKHLSIIDEIKKNESRINDLNEEIESTKRKLKTMSNRTISSKKTMLIFLGLIGFTIFSYIMNILLANKDSDSILGAIIVVIIIFFIVFLGSFKKYKKSSKTNEYDMVIVNKQSEINKRKEHIKSLEDEYQKIKSENFKLKGELRLFIEDHNKFTLKYPIIKEKLMLGVDVLSDVT